MKPFVTYLHKIRRICRMRGLIASVAAVAFLGTWLVYGGGILSAINPALERELAVIEHPALDVWVTPPDYAHAPPMIISTPAGVRFEHDVLTLPQGSILSAHLAEQSGDVPRLIIDGGSTAFSPDSHGDFGATQVLNEGRKLSIKRGWVTLASWKIRVIPDNPPKVTLTEQPSVNEDKSLRLSYSASDEFRVTEVALRVTPSNPLPGANNLPVEILLPVPSAPHISRVDFQDLTSHPWAGQKVSLQIVATNEAGRRSLSEAADIVVPERFFYHPIARVLIEERKKLLQRPDDQRLREEAANIMAGIAHEATNYHGDPVILMALRSGAVRLVLGRSREAAISVNDLLWQAATRIEDGSKGTIQRTLRDASQDMANSRK